MKKRPQKGSYTYHSWQKKYTFLRTILYFAIVLAVFIAGLIIHKTRNNTFTIIAILGVLPAAKSLVNTLMYLRNKSVTEEFHSIMSAYEDKMHILYNMLVSSSERIYFFDCMAITDHSVYLYTTNKKTAGCDVEKYIKNILSNHGKGNVNVKLYKSEKELLNRLSTIKKEVPTDDYIEFENKIVEIITSFSL